MVHDGIPKLLTSDIRYPATYLLLTFWLTTPICPWLLYYIYRLLKFRKCMKIVMLSRLRREIVQINTNQTINFEFWIYKIWIQVMLSRLRREIWQISTNQTNQFWKIWKDLCDFCHKVTLIYQEFDLWSSDVTTRDSPCKHDSPLAAPSVLWDIKT